MTDHLLRIFLAAVTSATLTLVAAPAVTADDGTLDLTSVTTRWPAASAVARGTRAVVSGRVTGGPRRVLLEHRTRLGWQRLAATRTRTSGGYTIRIPTRWFTRHRLRVRVPRTDRHRAARSRAHGLTVATPYRPRGRGSWRRLIGWRFDPCDAITYRVNRRRMPTGAMRDLRRAVRLTARATGLRFRYAGGSRQVPWLGSGSAAGPRTRSVARADLLIGWATPRQVPDLRGRTTGIGGPSSGHGRDARGNVRTLDAMVAFDATAKVRRGFGPGYTRGELFLHEIGHALGLAHTGGRHQVMSPANLRRDRWGSGDLSALRAIGRTGGCFDD